MPRSTKLPTPNSRPTLARWGLLALTLACSGACKKEPPSAGDAPHVPAPEPAAAAELPTVQPAQLAEILAKGPHKPLLLHVGFKKLYLQAHIPGSEYLGPTSDAEALSHLKQRVAGLPKSTAIVIYCGCCPWEHCPNVKPASEALHALGFTNAKVLFIAKDFGADWVDKGYPVATGA